MWPIISKVPKTKLRFCIHLKAQMIPCLWNSIENATYFLIVECCYDVIILPESQLIPCRPKLPLDMMDHITLPTEGWDDFHRRGF